MRYIPIQGVALVLAAMTALSACTVAPPARPDDPAWAPVASMDMSPPPPNTGGIYRTRAGLSLFDDNRANRIGDVLTVTLSERTTSSKQADTEISKEDKINLNAGAVLGKNVSFGDYNLNTDLSGKRDFEAETESTQSNNLQGSITVTVSAVLPNGLLEVRGEKWLTLNRGEEFIRLRGLVRPEDIAPDNTVPSTRLADVRIAYSGTGELADANGQGWLSRFFSSPYWPF